MGFPSIVGSGPNSVLLHYDKNRRRMEAGDLVVMDIGAEYGYLTADVTRTAPVSGKFTARQRAIYELVLGAQQAAIDAVRPGMDIPSSTRSPEPICGPTPIRCAGGRVATRISCTG